MEKEEIGSKAIRSIVVLTGRSIFLQAVSAVAFFLLGIFLSPSALGVYIVVSSIMRILTLFTDVGLGAAIVQKKDDLDQTDLKTAFTIQEMLVIPVVLVGWIVSPFVSRYAGLDSDGIVLYQVLVFTLFISSLKVIPSILLERRLAFDKQVLPQIVEALVFNLLVVPLAYKGFGVASYSWAVLASSLVSLPIYYWLSPWKVSIGIDWTKAKKLLSFGAAYQGKSVLAVVKDDLLTLFLSGHVGTGGVGYWGWAQRWSYFPFRFVVDSVTKVTFPAYSRLQQEQELLCRAIEKSLFAVSAILFPILAALAVNVPDLIQLIPKYAKWEPAVISFWLLCAGAAISSLSNILVNSLDAIGKVRTTLGLMVVWIVLTWGLTVAFVTGFGFTGIAAASFLVSLTIVLTVYLAKKHLRFHFWRNIFRQIGACGLMIAGMILVKNCLSVGYWQIALTVGIGGIIYLGVMMLVAGHEIRQNAAVVLKVFTK
jgi:PST family polysaccharide transporter